MKKFIWTDELVLEFAKVATKGSYGDYQDCKTLESKLEKFKETHSNPLLEVSQEKLQLLYENACWYGYAEWKGKQYTKWNISQAAKINGFNLKFPTVQ